MSLNYRWVVATFFFVLLSFAALPAQSQVTSLRQVGGPDVQQEGSADGTYIRATRSGAESDTLWVWIQHVTSSHPPDWESASAADLVVWCHPDTYPSDKHILPNHHGRIAIVQQGERLWIVPEGTKFWVRHVNWTPPQH